MYVCAFFDDNIYMGSEKFPPAFALTLLPCLIRV